MHLDGETTWCQASIPGPGPCTWKMYANIQSDWEARSSEIFRAFQLGPSIGVEMAMFLCLARM